MNEQKINKCLQIAGFAGLIASLIFVGLELRQSREIAIADIYQQRTAMLIDVHSIRLTSELLHQAISKSQSTEELTPADLGVLRSSYQPIFAYWENNHFHYQMGLMPEEQWIASKNAMRTYLKNTPGALDWWETERTKVRKSFADAVDEVLQE